MERAVAGDVVVVPFPFSDLTQSKRRPALVLAELDGEDRILCQITSQFLPDAYAVCLADADFETGGLPRQSSIRPNRLFTAERSLILRTVGHVRQPCLRVVVDRVISILERDLSPS